MIGESTSEVKTPKMKSKLNRVNAIATRAIVTKTVGDMYHGLWALTSSVVAPSSDNDFLGLEQLTSLNTSFGSSMDNKSIASSASSVADTELSSLFTTLSVVKLTDLLLIASALDMLTSSLVLAVAGVVEAFDVIVAVVVDDGTVTGVLTRSVLVTTS